MIKLYVTNMEEQAILNPTWYVIWTQVSTN